MYCIGGQQLNPKQTMVDVDMIYPQYIFIFNVIFVLFSFALHNLLQGFLSVFKDDVMQLYFGICLQLIDCYSL